MLRQQLHSRDGAYVEPRVYDPRSGHGSRMHRRACARREHAPRRRLFTDEPPVSSVPDCSRGSDSARLGGRWRSAIACRRITLAADADGKAIASCLRIPDYQRTATEGCSMVLGPKVDR